MLRIVLFGDTSQNIKMVEQALTQYLEKNNIIFEMKKIHGIKEFIDYYASNYAYDLYITCITDTVIYDLNVYDDYNNKESRRFKGILTLPLTDKEIREKLFKKREYHNKCPYGICSMYANYEDIEFITNENSQSILHLTDGSTKNTERKLMEITKALDERCFVKLGNKFIVNIFNVKKLDAEKDIVLFNSGASLPLKRNERKKIEWILLSYAGLITIK